jgi:hypothetical protein
MILPAEWCRRRQPLDTVIGEVRRDQAEAATPRRQRIPERLDAVAERRNATVTSDYYPPSGLTMWRHEAHAMLESTSLNLK